MNNPLEIAQSLKKEIENEPLIIEYRRVKKAIENNQEIQTLKIEIVNSKRKNTQTLHEQLLNRYNSHPLIQNYNFLLEEVKAYLLEISEIVNKK